MSDAVNEGWTHADGDASHPVDPHYNGNGLPAWWTCAAKNCDRALHLDGKRPPITAPSARKSDVVPA